MVHVAPELGNSGGHFDGVDCDFRSGFEVLGACEGVLWGVGERGGEEEEVALLEDDAPDVDRCGSYNVPCVG